jgi:hypothetical protein
VNNTAKTQFKAKVNRLKRQGSLTAGIDFVGLKILKITIIHKQGMIHENGEETSF